MSGLSCFSRWRAPPPPAFGWSPSPAMRGRSGRGRCAWPPFPVNGGGAKGCGASWVQIRIGGGGRRPSSLLGVRARRPVRGAVDGMTSPVRRLAKGGAGSGFRRRLPEHLRGSLALKRRAHFGALRGSLALKGRAHSRADGFHQGLEMVFGSKRASLARATQLHYGARVTAPGGGVTWQGGGDLPCR